MIQTISENEQKRYIPSLKMGSLSSRAIKVGAALDAWLLHCSPQKSSSIGLNCALHQMHLKASSGHEFAVRIIRYPRHKQKVLQKVAWKGLTSLGSLPEVPQPLLQASFCSNIPQRSQETSHFAETTDAAHVPSVVSSDGHLCKIARRMSFQSYWTSSSRVSSQRSAAPKKQEAANPAVHSESRSLPSFKAIFLTAATNSSASSTFFPSKRSWSRSSYKSPDCQTSRTVVLPICE